MDARDIQRSACHADDRRASAEDRTALRRAMLSVYHGSLGRQMTSTGAPAVMLPLPVRPLSLGDALKEIADEWPERLGEAVWRIVRSVPPPGPNARDVRRYPRALRDLADGLEDLDRLRLDHRADANLFAAALVARAQERTHEFDALRAVIESRGSNKLSEAAQALLGMGVFEFLDTRDGDTAAALSSFEAAVGLNLYDYARELADALAFVEWWPPERDDWRPGKEHMTVYPATSVITQDASTLVTSATVTALVRCEDFDTLARAVDPECWDLSSDVITDAHYVVGSYDLRPVSRSERLEEKVTVAWGTDEAMATFHNVLRIESDTVDSKIDVGFRLARSIDSRVLWDEQPGGIVVDHGSLKVRPLGEGLWGVMSDKTLLFSDRSPNVGRLGWVDYGQLLNYLAPAALSWWLESELYSAADEIYAENGAMRHGNGDR